MYGLGERHEPPISTDVVMQALGQILGSAGLDFAVCFQGGRVEARFLHALELIVCREQPLLALQLTECPLFGHERELLHVYRRATGLAATTLDQFVQAFELARSQPCFELAGLEPDRIDVVGTVELHLGLEHFSPGNGGERGGHGGSGLGQDRLAIEDQRIEQGRFAGLDSTDDADVHQSVFILKVLTGLGELVRLVDAVHPPELGDFLGEQVLVAVCQIVQALAEGNESLIVHDAVGPSGTGVRWQRLSVRWRGVPNWRSFHQFLLHARAFPG